MLVMQNTTTTDKVLLEVSTKPLPNKLKDNEVLIRVEASPINPSDVAALLAFGDPATCVTTTENGNVTATLEVPAKFRPAMRGRVAAGVPCGNEGYLFCKMTLKLET